MCVPVGFGMAGSLVDQNIQNNQGILNRVSTDLPDKSSDPAITDINTTELSQSHFLNTVHEPNETHLQGAQNVIYLRNIRVACIGGTHNESGYSVQQTSDWGYILAGTTDSSDGDMSSPSGYHGLEDAFVAKLDASFSIQWVRCVGGTSDEECYSVQQTSDGGYILAGTTKSSNGDMASPSGYHGLEDAFVAKLNSVGTVQWVRCVGGTNADTCKAVQQTTDGGYVLGGYTFSSDGDMASPSGYHGLGDAFVAKLNSVGTVQWVRCVGGTNPDICRAVQQTTDGGYILGGYTYSSNGDMIGAGYHGMEDAFVAKLNSVGTVQWVRCVGGMSDEECYSVQQDTDGGYVLAGYTYSSDGDMYYAVHYEYDDAFMAKLNSVGMVQGVRCIGGTLYDRGYSIQITLDGGYVLTGYTSSSDGYFATPIGTHGGTDAFVIKLGSDFFAPNYKAQWSLLIGGDDSDDGYSVQQMVGGDYVLAGRTSSWRGDMNNSGYHGGKDSFVAKLPIPHEKLGVFMNGQWFMDSSDNCIWDGQPPDLAANFGFSGSTPVVNDWDSDGEPEICVFKDGEWYVDYGGINYHWDGITTDRLYHFGFPGAIPVIGDWNGDTEPEIGVYNAGTWYLDTNSNNTWDGTGTGKDACYTFGFPGASPIVLRDSTIGVYANGIWYIDFNGNRKWDGTHDEYCGIGCWRYADRAWAFGFAGASPVIREWNQDIEIGVYNAGTWYLDTDNTKTWNANDRICTFGGAGFVPVFAKWT